MKLVPKYQEGNLVARQDNTRIAKSPSFKPIKRIIHPKPQPVISQDNRTGWQRKQDSDRGDKEYNRYIEAKKTEEGLHNLNGFLNFADYAGIATGIGGLASKGLKWGAKKVVKRGASQLVKRRVNKENTKQMINQGKDYTDRLLLALGDKKDLRLNSTMKFGNLTIEFANYLRQQGVDISKFTDKDIIRLMGMRNRSIKGNLPESGRFTLITEALSEGIPRYQSELYSGRNNLIGNLSGTIDGTDLRVNSVSKESSLLNRETGVSEDLYNSAIQYTNQRGYKGLRTGDLLQSPEITYKVWDKFPDKELVGTFGEHKFNFGQTIRNPELNSKTILDGNVYRLTKPTRFIPTKNEWMFHPSVINSKTGNLNPPDWNDTNIYKAIIPIGVGLNSINYEKEE